MPYRVRRGRRDEEQPCCWATRGRHEGETATVTFSSVAPPPPGARALPRFVCLWRGLPARPSPITRATPPGSLSPWRRCAWPYSKFRISRNSQTFASSSTVGSNPFPSDSPPFLHLSIQLQVVLFVSCSCLLLTLLFVLSLLFFLESSVALLLRSHSLTSVLNVVSPGIFFSCYLCVYLLTVTMMFVSSKLQLSTGLLKNKFM